MFGRRVGLMLNAWSRAVVREEVDWAEVAAGSLLRTAVGHWRDDADGWFAAAYERLPETARVNPLSRDFQWVESWLLPTTRKLSCALWRICRKMLGC